MTIKEEKVLKNYIKGLIRESLFGGKNSKNTMKSDAIRSWSPEKEEPGRSIDDMLKSGEIRTWHREDEPERSIDDMIDAGIIHTWDKHKDGGMPEDDPQTELGDYGNPAGIDELRKLCENFAREAMFGNEQDYGDDPFGPEDDDMMNDNPGLNQPSAKFMSKEYMAWAQKVADQAMKKYGRERAVDIWRDLTDQSNEEENMRRFKAETSAFLNELNGHEDLFGDVEDPEDFDFNNVDDDDFDDEDYEQDYGIYELRKLCEGMARQSVAQMLTEKKGGKGWKNKGKSKKRKNKKEKTSSKDRTIVSKLNADGTNAAHYFYKLYGVENGTEAEKASARSKGYKKAKGKKNDTGVPYKFTSRERNRLNSLLTDK